MLLSEIISLFSTFRISSTELPAVLGLSGAPIAPLARTIPVRCTSLWLTLHPFAIKHCTEVTQPEHLPSQSDNDTREVTAMEEGTWTSTQTREGFQKIPSNKSPRSS